MLSSFVIDTETILQVIGFILILIRSMNTAHFRISQHGSGGVTVGLNSLIWWVKPWAGYLRTDQRLVNLLVTRFSILRLKIFHYLRYGETKAYSRLDQPAISFVSTCSIRCAGPSHWRRYGVFLQAWLSTAWSQVRTSTAFLFCK